MRFFCALFLGLAVVAAQVLHGGLQWPALLTPSSVLLILAGVSALFVVGRNRMPAAPGALLGVALFTGYIIWRCSHSEDVYLSRIEATQALAGALAFFVASCGLGDAKSRFLFLGILIAAASVQAVLGFVQFSLGGLSSPLGWFSLALREEYAGRFGTRAHGFFINPNQFAWLESWAALFCVALACWARVGVVMRVVLIYLALVFIAAGVFSGSRGGMIALVAGLAVFGLVSLLAVVTTMRRGRLPIVLGASALLAVCVGAGFAVYSTNWVAQARVDALQNIDVREFYLHQALRQFQSTPLLGGGPESFRYAARLSRMDNFSGDAIYAHDDWLQTLAEYGLVGLGIAVLTVVMLLGGGLKRFLMTVRNRALGGERPQSNTAAILLGALSATVAFCIHSGTDFNMHIPANAMLAGATLGLLAGITPGERQYSGRLPLGILRSLGGLATAAILTLLAVLTWRHGIADYQSLLAANALAEGNVKEARMHAEEGLKRQPHDAALLATKGRALYAYESSLAFDANPDDESADGTEDLPETESETVPTLTPQERRKIYQASADAFAQALTQQPSERAFHLELAKALTEIGNRKASETEYLEGIRLDPGSDYSYGTYGDYLYNAEKLQLALRIYSMGTPLVANGYCATREQDVREELTAPPDEDAPSANETSASEAGTSGDDKKGGRE